MRCLINSLSQKKIRKNAKEIKIILKKKTTKYLNFYFKIA